VSTWSPSFLNRACCQSTEGIYLYCSSILLTFSAWCRSLNLILKLSHCSTLINFHVYLSPTEICL
jgi:hypothetical protein